MRDLYHLAKAVYAGDLAAAQGVLDHMRHRDFDVLRAKLAVGRAPAAEPIPVNAEVQARLDKLMQPVEDEMDNYRMRMREHRRKYPKHYYR